MDADLIVVGAGICGSAATIAARTTGATVLHLAAEETPHSTAAAAVARSTYLTPPQRPHLPASLNLLREAITCTGALFSNYQTPHKRPTQRPDWWLIDPRAPLLSPDVTTAVLHVSPGRVETDTGTYTAPAILLATGATSHLSPRGTTTWGTTWTGPVDALVYPDLLRVHLYAPYKAITAGPAHGHARVGSSSGPTPDAALEAGQAMLQRATDAGLVATPHAFTPLTGARLKTTTTALFHTPTLAWVGGHHRNGYAYGTYEAAHTARTLLTNTRETT